MKDEQMSVSVAELEAVLATIERVDHRLRYSMTERERERVTEAIAWLNRAIYERPEPVPPQRPVLWAHQDNPSLTTTREPLGPGWEPLYRREPAVERATLLDPRGSLGEPVV